MFCCCFNGLSGQTILHRHGKDSKYVLVFNGVYAMGKKNHLLVPFWKAAMVIYTHHLLRVLL